MNKQTVADDETIAVNVHDTLTKLRNIESAGLAGKRFVLIFVLNIFCLKGMLF